MGLMGGNVTLEEALGIMYPDLDITAADDEELEEADDTPARPIG